MNKKNVFESFARSFPIDGSGTPTSHVAYLLIVKLFQEQRVNHRVRDLAMHIALPIDVTDIMCQQLASVDIVTEVSPYSRIYRYNRDCTNEDLQSGVEMGLLDFSRRAAA